MLRRACVLACPSLGAGFTTGNRLRAGVFAGLRRNHGPHKRGRMCYVGSVLSTAPPGRRTVWALPSKTSDYGLWKHRTTQRLSGKNLSQLVDDTLFRLGNSADAENASGGVAHLAGPLEHVIAELFSLLDR